MNGVPATLTYLKSRERELMNGVATTAARLPLGLP
jgi:hypothetical protein